MLALSFDAGLFEPASHTATLSRGMIENLLRIYFALKPDGCAIGGRGKTFKGRVNAELRPGSLRRLAMSASRPLVPDSDRIADMPPGQVGAKRVTLRCKENCEIPVSSSCE